MTAKVVQISIDGHFLNRALHSESRRRNDGGRVRVDYAKLKGVLLPEVWGQDSTALTPEDVCLDYYCGFPFLPNDGNSHNAGILTKWKDNAYGQIEPVPRGSDKKQFFVHKSDITTRNFYGLKPGVLLRFVPGKTDRGDCARNVMFQEDYQDLQAKQQTRQNFLDMLETADYNVQRCRPNPRFPTGASEESHLRMVRDIMTSLDSEAEDAKIVLCTGDANFGFLLRELREEYKGVEIRLATFPNSVPSELLAAVSKSEIIDLGAALERGDLSLTYDDREPVAIGANSSDDGFDSDE